MVKDMLTARAGCADYYRGRRPAEDEGLLTDLALSVESDTPSCWWLCFWALNMRSFIVNGMNGRGRHRMWAWLLCALLFWLAANPPHCDRCDGVSFTVAAAQQPTLKDSPPVEPDTCNGICSCCAFHGLPYGQHAFLPVNAVLAAVTTEAPRAAFVLPTAIFRPPRIVAS
jgi:hypothetical protein